MIDLRLLRREPERFREGWRKRGLALDPETILQVDGERRRLQKTLDEVRAKIRSLAKEVGRRRRSGEPVEELLQESRALSEEEKRLEKAFQRATQRLQEMLLEVPNLPADAVPEGAGPEDNVVVRTWGEKPAFSFTPKPHWEIGEKLGILDIPRGAKISGSRFYVLRGWGARLERALINFMLDLHTREHGYEEVFPPFLVRPECMVGTGQLPKFEEDMYFVERDDLYLEPTAEVPVTNLHREEILSEDDLPIKYCAYTACFRREAGAAGKETRGVIRVHQFNKVELVKFTRPEDSMHELESLLADAEEVLRRLGLHYRVVLLCTGDLGFSSAITYDLEVWMPGEDRYVEVSSVSNFTDFQARRANIRFRRAHGKPEFVHTLNGSGLAVGRTWAAVLENYQTPDGRIRVPEVLRPYLGVEVFP